MKKLSVLLLVFFMGSVAHAEEISGVYENRHVTVSIEKDGPAWRLECDDEDQGHVYLSKEKKAMTDPFEPAIKCRPKKRLTDNVYRITIKPKTKIECGIIPKPGCLAEYAPDVKELSIHPYLDMNFHEEPTLLVHKPGLFDEDCRKLSEDLKKIK